MELSLVAVVEHPGTRRWSCHTSAEKNPHSRPGRSQVALEGWYHIQFSLMLRLDQLEVSGRMRFRAKPDFSSIVLSFASLPSFKLRAECTVSWGVVPLPIQEYLQASPRTFFAPRHAPRPTCQALTKSMRPRLLFANR